jgi:hypothetical protein
MTQPAISVDQMDAQAAAQLKKDRQRRYNAAYRAKLKALSPTPNKPEPSKDEVFAKVAAQRAKTAAYQKKWLENLTPEQREAKRLARNAYAATRYAKMRDIYLEVLAERTAAEGDI